MRKEQVFNKLRTIHFLQGLIGIILENKMLHSFIKKKMKNYNKKMNWTNFNWKNKMLNFKGKKKNQINYLEVIIIEKLVRINVLREFSKFAEQICWPLLISKRLLKKNLKRMRLLKKINLKLISLFRLLIYYNKLDFFYLYVEFIYLFIYIYLIQLFIFLFF